MNVETTHLTDTPIAWQPSGGHKLHGESLSEAQCLSGPAPILRPYQVALVERLRGAYRAGYRAPLLQLATAGGKTHIFTAAIAGARGRGKRVLVVAHRRELIRQA